MAPAVGARTKKRVVREMHEILRASMTQKFARSDDNAQTFESARAQADFLVQLKYHEKKQTSYKEIPVLPNKQGLCSTPQFQELNSLFIQMHELALKVASLIISTHKSKRRQSDQLAVTSKTPGSVLVSSALLPIQNAGNVGMEVDAPESSKTGKKAGPVGMEVDAPESSKGRKKAGKPETSNAGKKAGKSESSKSAERKRRSFAPPDAKVPSKMLEKEKEGEEVVQIKGKDTYHIIRIGLMFEGKRIYLELLREDSDGYIAAFRILYSLKDFEKAYWCAFSDFARLKIHLPFIDIRMLNYGSGYASSSISETYYGKDTLDVIIREFLLHLYSDPFQHDTTTGKIYFEILCLVFGEAPRFEAVQKFLEKHSQYPHDLVSSQWTPEYKLGSLLNNLILKWSNTGDTALYLLLIQFERYIKEGIEAPRITSNRSSSSSASLSQLYEQFEYNRIVAHDRCVTAIETLQNILLLSSEDDSGLYNELALFQLLNEQLHLLKYEDSLVTSIILRQGGFRRIIPLLGYNREARNIGNKLVKSQEVIFWDRFNRFELRQRWEETTFEELMIFLEEARPLSKFGFKHRYPNTSDLVDAKCDAFNQMRFNPKIVKKRNIVKKRKINRNAGDAAAAAVEAIDTGVKWSETMDTGVKWEQQHTCEIMKFLKEIRDLK